MNPESNREQQFLRRLGVVVGHLFPDGVPSSSQLTTTDTSADELYGRAQMPGKVKRQEAPYDKDNNRTEKEFSEANNNQDKIPGAPVRINAAYCDLDSGGGFTPVAGVIYLWAIRADGHLVVGVEDPSKMKAAFGFDPAETVKAMQAKKRELGEDVPSDDVLDGLGHPTLAVQFGPSGEAMVGPARISGELEYDGGWRINDHSGRYSAGRTEVLPQLVQAALKFQSFGVDVRFIQSKVDLGNATLSLDDVLARISKPKL